MALNLPKQIRAGDTLSFTDQLADYSALDGWTLVYALVNRTNQITITSSASGSDHAVSEVYAVTEGYAPGTYRYQAYVDDGSDRHTVESGTVEILPDLKGGMVDDRSHAEKVLEALEATMEGKASQDQLSMSINGRSLTRFSPAELMKWRDRYKAEVNQQRMAEKIKAGLNTGRKTQIRFR